MVYKESWPSERKGGERGKGERERAERGKALRCDKQD